tara:strand:+ start:146 stop:568 length:423 start_codon:yes stop_codon:yes gene_type:complete
LLTQSQSVSNPIQGKKRRAKRKCQDKLTSTPKKEKIDSATLASRLQLKQERRELFYSLIALSMKMGLLVLFAGSFFKLGFASHQRVRRHSEITSLLKYETIKLEKLKKRFDRLFTIGGDQRLMEEQGQWIAPNTVRIIWR